MGQKCHLPRQYIKGVAVHPTISHHRCPWLCTLGGSRWRKAGQWPEIRCTKERIHWAHNNPIVPLGEETGELLSPFPSQPSWRQTRKKARSRRWLFSRVLAFQLSQPWGESSCWWGPQTMYACDSSLSWHRRSLGEFPGAATLLLE